MSPMAPLVPTPTPPTSLRIRRRPEPTPPPDREFVAVTLDSIASPGPAPDSPRGRAVGIEPQVQVTEEELAQLNYNEAALPVEELAAAMMEVPAEPPAEFAETVAEAVAEAAEVSAASLASPPKSEIPAELLGEESEIPGTMPRRTAAADEEIDEDEKDLTDEQKWLLMRARIQVIKRGWPDLYVPEECDRAKISLLALTKYYKKLKSRVFAEECSGGYKKWLIAMFVFLEVLCVRVFKIDMNGFTMNQIQAMNSYQALLLELAEKYGSSYRSYFPVELRLMFMVLVNGVIFFVLKLLFGDGNSEGAKAIASALGGNGENAGMAGIVGNVMNMLTGGPPKTTGSEELKGPTAPRRKRRDETPTL
jgi:hypothetical protein